MEEKNNNNNNKTSALKIIGNTIYTLLIAILILVDVSLIYQQIFYKDKIPSILNHKIFMIGKDYMDETLNDGDLIFTKNIEPTEIKVGDIIAFRNSNNLVTVHEVLEIDNTKNNEKFITKTAENEVQFNKYVNFSRLEGILVYKIPMLGKIILFIINPIVLFSIILIILIVGFVLYKLAKKQEEKAIENTDNS